MSDEAYLSLSAVADSDTARRKRRPSTDIRLLWLLRILVPLKGISWLLQHDEFYGCDRVAEFVGLPPDLNRADKPAHRTFLHKAWVEAESRADQFRLRQPFARNLESVSSLFGLSKVEKDLLGFALTAAFDPLIEPIIVHIPELSHRVAEPWAQILKLPKGPTRRALSERSRLGRAGLFQMESPIVQAVSAISVNRPELGGIYSDRDWRHERLLAGMGRKAGPPELRAADYPHLSSDIELMLRYLKRAMARGRKGVNILLHGAPGSGKTQLARVLGCELGVDTFEVATTDSDGDAASGIRRFSMLSTLQKVLSGKSSLIVFDEIDQVFADGNWFTGVRTTAEKMRGWLVDHLESNPVPTIWIGNDVLSVDPAFARRFDIVLEMNAPPRLQRTEMIRRHAGALLTEDQIRKLSQVETLSPATLRRAARVVSGAGLRDTKGARAMERLIDQSLRVQSHNPRRDPIPGLVVPDYDPSLAQCSGDLQLIADGLARSAEGRLCLYGPPGTGKSAFGHWLGERLGRPVLLRRASDLLGPFVGQTEENIARAFRSAQQDGAILQIDEVDGFLGNRQNARASWEASLVNEMLTQMEAFKGIFIASTNLMDGLDPAAMRRFDAKLMFGFLRPEQSWRLLARLCERLGINLRSEDEEVRSGLASLSVLTPGDFASVERRHRFEPFADPREIVAALDGECRLKPGVATRRIGFV